MTATDTTVKDLSTLNLEGAVETVLADDICVGGVYNYNAAVAKPEEIYIKKAFDVKLVSTCVSVCVCVCECLCVALPFLHHRPPNPHC